MNPGEHDDDRDAWLRAALRHAPDAQAAPPAALSDAILRAARAAARPAPGAPARTTPRRSAWAAFWAGLARPPVAAGFASLMVATLVGLIWWDQPIDPTVVRAPAPPANTESSSAPAAPIAPIPTPPATDARSDQAAPADARLQSAPVPAAPTATASPRARPAAPRAAAPAADTARESAAQRAAPAPAAAAAPAPFADRRAPAELPSTAEVGNAAGAVRDEAAGSSDAATSRRSSSSAAKAAAPAAAARLRQEASAGTRPAALGDLLRSVEVEPQRWSWQRGESSRQALTPALQRWLRQLDAASAGRWHDGAAPPPDARVLQLYRDAVPAATLRVGDDTVWLAPASQAGLSRSASAALRQALDDAAP